MQQIVVIGSSGHAKVVIDIIEKQRSFSILGLIGNAKSPGPVACGYPILGLEQDLLRIAQTHPLEAGIVAIGDNWIRARAVEKIRQVAPDFRFVTAIHPSVQIGRGVSVGAGTVIMAGAIVNTASTIGEHCIINTKASVDHDNMIGNFVSLAPNATTGGNVTIGDFGAVCMGANVIHGITIGEHTVIGAGSTVLHDLPPFIVAFGTPATVRHARVSGDKYL